MMLRLTIFLFIFSSQLGFASMQEMVEYLSSDALEGRKPGQLGNELAIDYLVQRLQELGLEPLNTEGFKEEFTIFTEMQKIPGSNFLKVNEIQGEFEPLSLSLSSALSSSELVFAGFGISIPMNDPNLSYDDYAAINVQDKIVVVLSGDPGIGNENSKFRHPDYINYRSLFYKMQNAIKHGAKGFLYIENPLGLSGPETPLFFNSSEGGGSRFSLVAGKTSIAFFNQFLERTNLEEIQQKIATTQNPFSFRLGKKIELSVGLKKMTGRVANIHAVLPGETKDAVVIGAHMDHLGYGGESSMDSDPTPKIHNGADDNASGTAMVIELAKKLKKQKHKKTYIFSLFNAEEMGLLGSQYFVSNYASRKQERGPIIAMLNFDMVGRYSKEFSVMGTGSSKDWQSLIAPLTTDLEVSLKQDALGSSDHASFIQQKIPALFITTGAHEDYHRSTDDAEKINFTAMQDIANYAFDLVTKIDSAGEIIFNETYGTGQSNSGRGYGASLGCIPKFGQSDQIQGVVCTGTSPASPAETAGMQAGDILVKIGEVEIKSVYDLAFSLKYYRAGDKVQIAWQRQGTLMSQMVTLKKSTRSQ